MFIFWVGAVKISRTLLDGDTVVELMSCRKLLSPSTYVLIDARLE